MKKLLLLFAVFMATSTLFSQTIMTTWEFGPTALTPILTFNGAPGDYEIVAHVNVQNTGSAPIRVKVACEVMNLAGNSTEQFCWANSCYPSGTDTSGLFMELAPGEITDEFSGHVYLNGTSAISVIKYTFFEEGNLANKSEVLISFNSLFSLSCDATDTISEHGRKLTGTVDIPFHGVIKVHNHAAADLNLIAFRQPAFIVPGSVNWMWFGGTEYPATVDTTALTTIPGNTVDTSFMPYYDADGNQGVSQMVYAFLDATNPSNFALYWIHFDAQAAGISDELVANTVFSPAYPNPADDFISFDYDIPAEANNAEIMITNLLGAVVYEGSLNGLTGTKRIDISNLTGGIYFVTLKLDSEITKSQKILVQ